MKHYRLIHLFTLPALIGGLLIISVNQNAGAALSIAGMTAFLSSFAETLRNRPEENWVKERKPLARIIGGLVIGGSLLSLGYVISMSTGDNPILFRVKVLGMLVFLSGLGALVLSLAIANRHGGKDHSPDFSGIPGLPTPKKKRN